jgi:LPS-assembly protein
VRVADAACSVPVNPLASPQHRGQLQHGLLALVAAALLLPGTVTTAQPYGEGRFAACPVMAEGAVPPDLGTPDVPGSLILEADYAEIEEKGLKTFLGRVEGTREDLAMRGDRLVYDEAAGVIDLLGAVEVWNESLYWSGEHARTHLEDDRTLLEEGNYRLRMSPGHGEARRIEDTPATGLTVLEGTDYTTCQGERPDWRVRTARLKIDQTAERAYARHLRLYARGVPVFYTPWISFPLTEERQTGFLTPTFGSSRKNDTDISAPFYWNIAPEYDATFGPRHLGKRGTMVNGEFRYLLDTGQGDVGLNWLPNDNLRDESRSLFTFNHQQTFLDQRVQAFATYSAVSDRFYFEDFGNSLAVTSQQFLEQRLDLSGQYGRWGALFRVQNFQSVDPSLAFAGPYKRLPQLIVSGMPIAGGNRHLNLSVNLDANYFEREQSVTGARLDSTVNLSLPWVTASGYVTPRVGLRGTQYALDDDPAFASAPGRLIPVASLDTGLFLERDVRLFGREQLQTLEPRIYYLFVGQQNQDRFPVFDTGLYDFTFSQLFRDDRFAGGDRVGDANQVTLAMTSRLFDHKGGLERMRFSAGQIQYLDRQTVTLPGTDPETDSSSELVGELSLMPTDALRLSGNLTWDPHIPQTRRGTFYLRYAPDDERILNLGYRVRRGIAQVPTRPSLEQVEASTRWPIRGAASFVGRVVYSVAQAQTIESFGGIEYDSCCWAARGVIRRYVTSSTNQFDTGYFFLVELKGLTGIGAATETFIERYIPGYDSPF